MQPVASLRIRWRGHGAAGQRRDETRIRLADIHARSWPAWPAPEHQKFRKSSAWALVIGARCFQTLPTFTRLELLPAAPLHARPLAGRSAGVRYGRWHSPYSRPLGMGGGSPA